MQTTCSEFLARSFECHGRQPIRCTEQACEGTTQGVTNKPDVRERIDFAEVIDKFL